MARRYNIYGHRNHKKILVDTLSVIRFARALAIISLTSYNRVSIRGSGISEDYRR